jgi:cbb3-type cytochrome oxidase subunit 1
VGLNFLRIATVYLIVGVVMGFVMGITEAFQYAPVHAHVNLLGWASLGLAGVIYHLYPAAAETRLARVHFWLHNLGLPVFMVSLAVMLAGSPAANAGVKIGATMTVLGLMAFAANLFANVRRAA